jgi:hypothetical protein
VIPRHRVMTLDHVFKKNQMLTIDFLKLDVQGSELDILKGATDLLKHSLLGAKIEVEFVELYKGQPLFPDIHRFMTDSGFELIDIERAFRKRKEYQRFLGKGQLVFGNALYFRKLDSFFEMIDRGKLSEPAEIKIIKLILIAVIYGMHDYAVSLLMRAKKEGYLGEKTAREMFNDIMRFDTGYRDRPYPAERPLYRLFRKLLFRLQKNNRGWGYCDDRLGNQFF